MTTLETMCMLLLTQFIEAVKGYASEHKTACIVAGLVFIALLARLLFILTHRKKKETVKKDWGTVLIVFVIVAILAVLLPKLFYQYIKPMWDNTDIWLK